MTVSKESSKYPALTLNEPFPLRAPPAADVHFKPAAIIKPRQEKSTASRSIPRACFLFCLFSNKRMNAKLIRRPFIQNISETTERNTTNTEAY